MSQLTDYTENKWIDHMFRGRQWTAPTVIAMALFTAAPGEAGGGTEVSGGSYARVQQGPSDSTWRSTQGTTTAVASSGTSGQTTNAGVITFPVPTGTWGLITHSAIMDATTAGNMLMYGTLAASKNVNNGDPAPTFPDSSITVTVA